MATRDAICEEMFRTDGREDEVVKIDACLQRVHRLAKHVGVPINRPIRVERMRFGSAHFIKVGTLLEGIEEDKVDPMSPNPEPEDYLFYA